MLANIHLNDGISLDPDLAVVVEKLALKHPSWVFRSNATPDSNPSEYSSKHLSRWYDNPVANPVDGDQKKYVRTVAVLQDGLSAGRITVDRDYSRRATQNWQYEIVSPRIANGRKGEKLTTRDAGVAVRTASKHFMAPSVVEMLAKATNSARSSLSSTLRDLERPIERGQFCPDLTTMQLALYNLLRGVPFDERDLREKLLSDKYEQALADFELARTMRVHHMRSLIAFRGQYVYLRDGDPDPWYESEALKGVPCVAPFEELPQSWQDKIAVLQLMKDEELVLDVGYRMNESTFLIV
jgi:hypothetical protein